MEENKRVSRTKGTKKKLIIEQGAMNMYHIKYSEGGELPGVLHGDWNNVSMAQRAIDQYVSSKA